ncbi:hypothetical protein HanXRQr2_Chr13g0603871 [Helianthus annuus]|uniref:Uncharacterized protein n=1 Tax=Helianthus annuus TaxID=4232 RepID=A0A251SUP9_HELAN|nr:hypothetical protein HanXRQr2_Chr13g0603871 [Helianthus annuus]KAJ0850529.1 hypothetical protein HanPSC8_Chr13g0581901 [Helianthus annuus]
MQRWLHYGSYDDDDVHCRYYRILMKKLQNWIVTPQPMAESSARGTMRIRLFKRIHDNYIATVSNVFIIPY